MQTEHWNSRAGTSEQRHHLWLEGSMCACCCLLPTSACALKYPAVLCRGLKKQPKRLASCSAAHRPVALLFPLLHRMLFPFMPDCLAWQALTQVGMSVMICYLLWLLPFRIKGAGFAIQWMIWKSSRNASLSFIFFYTAGTWLFSLGRTTCCFAKPPLECLIHNLLHS